MAEDRKEVRVKSQDPTHYIRGKGMDDDDKRIKQDFSNEKKKTNSFLVKLPLIQNLLIKYSFREVKEKGKNFPTI